MYDNTAACFLINLKHWRLKNVRGFFFFLQMWRSKSRNEIKTDWLDWGETESLVAKWDSQRSASAWRRSHEMIYQRRRTGEEARQEWNAFIQKRIRVPISAHYYYCETRFGICLAKITIRTCFVRQNRLKTQNSWDNPEKWGQRCLLRRILDETARNLPGSWMYSVEKRERKKKD